MSSTHVHYRDYRDVRGDGRIILYRRADTVGQNWSVRLKIPGNTGYIVKSSKTGDDFEARRFAENLYFQLEGRAHRGEAIRSPTFSKVFEEWKSVKQLEEAVRTSNYNSDNIRRMELWAVPHLGNQLIGEIDDKAAAEYIHWRVTQTKKPPAISTLRNERTVLLQIFRFAKAKGYRTDIPAFRLPTSRQNARNDIPEAEWKTLCAYLPKYVDKARDRRRRRERFYLRHYILILGNSGIRVGEARTLRWRDISETRTISGDARVVFRVKGKTGAREVVCNKETIGYVERLRDFRIKEAGVLKLDEPIFCHPDGGPVGSFKGGFEKVLAEAGILYGPDGKARVPYSLRHSYCTMRLVEGVSVYDLAVNLGTSVQMVENFYGKRRVNPKMATELTKLREAPNARYLTPELLRGIEGKHPIEP